MNKSLLYPLAAIATIVGTVFTIMQIGNSSQYISVDSPVKERGIQNTTNEIEHNNVSPLKQSPVKSESSSLPSNSFAIEPLNTTNSYISNKTPNNINSKDIVITVFDASQQVNDFLINGISEYYTSEGYFSKYNIFNSSFYSDKISDYLNNGNLEYINKLKLQDFCDYLVIGKISCNYTPNTIDKNMVVAHATLNLKVISTKNPTIEKSVTIFSKKTGWSQDESKDNALKELLSQIPNKL